MPARGTLFLNRSSGVTLGPADLESLRDAAVGEGVEVLDISPDLDVVSAVRERLARGMRLFIAAGGDGTVHHVVQALVRTEGVLGVVPIGTYNHFARDLGIPLDWREALEVALAAEERQVDTAHVNDRFFVNNLSIGLYPELVARREERGRNYPRWKARLYAFYTTGRKFPHVTLTVDTTFHHELIRTHVFIVSNNPYDLGKIGIEATRTALDGAQLSVYWLPHTRRWRLMKFVARYLAGRVEATPGFRSFRATRMHVRASRSQLRVGMDGELFVLETPLVVTIVPRALTVRVPNAAAAE